MTLLRLLLLFCTLNIVESASLLNSIIESFNSDQIKCIVALADSKSKFFKETHDVLIGSYSFDFQVDEETLSKSSQFCKHHVIFLEDLEAIDSLNFAYFGSGKFAIILQMETLSLDQIQEMMFDPEFLGQIHQLAIFAKRSDEKYSVYARNVQTEQGLVLMNQWKNGTFTMENPIFPADRLENFNGIQLKATSFIYEPFIYKDPVNEGQFQGYEINILNDISSTLNFTYQIQAPTDGGLWGEVKNDGTATGLVGDIKVSEVA